ncbi:hypothetical protein ACCO45_009524 [Purpureocillium lilacinum]|uniref:Uncharacterized protein n=1 Tax=Purpureocillium lilacinum TaxID=33203 RepID=A0ACC4DN03_PURLI
MLASRRGAAEVRHSRWPRLSRIMLTRNQAPVYGVGSLASWPPVNVVNGCRRGHVNRARLEAAAKSLERAKSSRYSETWRGSRPREPMACTRPWLSVWPRSRERLAAMIGALTRGIKTANGALD